MCTAPGTIDAIAPFSAFREAVSFTLMNPMRAAELGPETPSSLPDDTWLRVIPRALGYTGSQRVSAPISWSMPLSASVVAL